MYMNNHKASPLKPTRRPYTHLDAHYSFNSQSGYHPHRNRYKSLRRRIQPSHESIDSSDRKSRDKSSHRHEDYHPHHHHDHHEHRIHHHHPPPNLIPCFNKEDRFRNDVLEIVKPLLEDLKENSGQEDDKMSTPVKNKSTGNNAVSQDENSKLTAIERTLNSLQKQIQDMSSYQKQDSKGGKDLEKRVKVLESRKETECHCPCQEFNLKQVFEEYQQKFKNFENFTNKVDKKLNQETDCECKGLNVQDVLENYSERLDVLEDEYNKVVQNTKNLKSQDSGESIEKIKKNFTELKNSQDQSNKTTKVLHETVENFKHEIAQLESELSEKLSAEDIAESGFVQQDYVKKMITELEKKISKTQTTSLSNIQEQIDKIEQKIEDIREEVTEEVTSLQANFKGKLTSFKIV